MRHPVQSRLAWLIEHWAHGLVSRDAEHELKEEFHRRGQAFLRALAKELGFKQGDFEVRSNRAGTAVLGEVSLRASGIYAELGPFSYFRSATAEDPYGTRPEHPNCTMPPVLLGSPALMAGHIKRGLGLS